MHSAVEPPYTPTTPQTPPHLPPHDVTQGHLILLIMGQACHRTSITSSPTFGLSLPAAAAAAIYMLITS